MSTACLRGFLDCSKHFEIDQRVGKQNEDCQKIDKWVRVALVTISFLIFGFLIGPQVQSTLPGRESVVLVSQSRQINIRPEISPRVEIDHKKAAKAVLAFSLVAGSQAN